MNIFPECTFLNANLEFAQITLVLFSLSRGFQQSLVKKEGLQDTEYNYKILCLRADNDEISDVAHDLLMFLSWYICLDNLSFYLLSSS